MSAMYIALTTTNPRQGYTVVAYGANKQAVERAARDAIGDIHTATGANIYRETRHRNLVVVSKTKAKRFGVDYDDAESFVRDFPDAVVVR